ncbi:MAG: hypothetical protein ACYTF1_06915 [Planctomycetota bacterium]|jgi:anti-sigma factor RsiW
MRCPQAKILLSVASDAELDEAGQQALEVHLAECQECQQFADDLQDLDRALTGWTVPEPRSGFTQRMMTSLPEIPAEKPWFREWFQALRPLTAAAATIALFCGATLGYILNSQQDTQQATSQDKSESYYSTSFDLVPSHSLGGAYLSFLQDTEQ